MDTGDHKTRDTYNTFQSQTWQILCVLYMSSIVHLSHQERKKYPFSLPLSANPSSFSLFLQDRLTRGFFLERKGVSSVSLPSEEGFKLLFLWRLEKQLNPCQSYRWFFLPPPLNTLLLTMRTIDWKKDQNSSERDGGTIHLCISHDTIHKTDRDSFFKEEKKRFYIPHKTKISGYWIWKNRALDLSFFWTAKKFPFLSLSLTRERVSILSDSHARTILWFHSLKEGYEKEKSPLEEKKSLASSSVTSFTRNIPLSSKE